MKQLTQKKLDEFIQEVMCRDFPGLDKDTAKQFLYKAFEVSVFEDANSEGISHWYNTIFKPNVFTLDAEKYNEACIQSLKIQFKIVGTDFGSSRKRDLGQKWADTIRGYLGELGVKLVLERRFKCESTLDHELGGSLEPFLPSDIDQVKTASDLQFRKSRLRISIKTTKSNGVWLDIPGDQFSRSDVYILALIGVGVDHLFSFFKRLSVFKDKILKNAIDNSLIDFNEAEEIYKRVPDFKPIFGYIPGFVTNDVITKFSYQGTKGRSNFKITDWSGRYLKEYLEEIKKEQNARKVEFYGIGDFTKENRNVFGLRSLKNSESDWRKFVLDRI